MDTKLSNSAKLELHGIRLMNSMKEVVHGLVVNFDAESEHTSSTSDVAGTLTILYVDHDVFDSSGKVQGKHVEKIENAVMEFSKRLIEQLKSNLLNTIEQEMEQVEVNKLN